MKNKVRIMKNTRDIIYKKKVEKQDKNKLWWETLPMTYADWESDKRIPQTKEDFAKVERLFLDGNPYLKEHFNFEDYSKKQVLEIGCGSGAASCLFAKAGAIVTAVDITENAIKITERNAKRNKLKIKAIRQDAEKLNFKDKTFDYVFSWGVLHHSKNTTKTFEEVSRVLKEGGEGLIMVYNKNSARYYINGLYWLLLKGKIFRGYNLKTVQDFYTDGYYHRHFTPRELRRKLNKVNLVCSRVEPTHMGGYRMLPQVPLKLENWIKRKYGWLLVARFKKKDL